MRAGNESAAGWTPAAASESAMLGGVDALEDSPNLSRIQSRWIAARFNMKPSRAALVAKLALAGAA